MASGEVVGRLKASVGPINFEWEIDEFLSLPAEVNDSYNSPVYFFGDSSWYLELYPKGEEEDSSEGYIGVYLMRGDSGPPLSATYSLFVKKGNAKEQVKKEAMVPFEIQNGGWGKSDCIQRSKVIQSKSEYLPSGVFTIICSLKCNETRVIKADETLRRAMQDCIISAEVSTETEKDVGTEKLLSDLKGLVDSGDESDVTIKVQGKEFQLHRAILAARTPVFQSMFKHNMKEKATGVVSVDDLEAGPFHTFVQYLYTGSTDELSQENVLSVYKIAHKYQVEGLKFSCLDTMKCMLSVETFCDIVDLALKYEEEDLMEEATEFLSKNTVDIMSTEEWRTLLRNNLIQINELIIKAHMKK